MFIILLFQEVQLFLIVPLALTHAIAVQHLHSIPTCMHTYLHLVMLYIYVLY